MATLLLDKTRIKEGDDLFKFVLSPHCIGQVRQLKLENCEIKNQTVERLVKEINKREKKKPVNFKVERNPQLKTQYAFRSL